MNRHDLQKLAEAYTNVHEGTMDIKGFEIPKKEQEAAAKRVKEKTAAKKKKNVRGYDSEEQKKRLEKKRGMKLDDHPQFKKEELEASGKFTAEEIEEILNNDINEVLGGQPGDGYVGHPRLKIKNPMSPPKKETKVAPNNKGLAGKLGNRATEIERMLGNSFEPEGEMVEGTVTNKVRADAGPPKTTVKMSASGQEPAGDKLLRNISNSFGNMMNRINPKAMQSKPAGPQRKPLISTPKEEVEHYDDKFKNAIHEAYEEDIKEFAMGEIGKALSGAGAQVADIAANHPVATAAVAGGALGALTGGKKKTKKGLGTAAGAALGAAVGGVPGAVIGGLAGNVVS